MKHEVFCWTRAHYLGTASLQLRPRRPVPVLASSGAVQFVRPKVTDHTDDTCYTRAHYRLSSTKVIPPPQYRSTGGLVRLIPQLPIEGALVDISGGRIEARVHLARMESTDVNGHT